jgi:hypothetical protein
MLKCSSALGSDRGTMDITLMGITGRTMATRITGRIIGTVATVTTATTIIDTITGTKLKE